MKLDSLPATAAFGILSTLTGPVIVQWFMLPESAPFLPDMASSDKAVMTFERTCHIGNILALSLLIAYYVMEQPKLFKQDHYGYFLVALLLQHVIEHYQHETGGSTTDSILKENRIWTTYAVAVFHLYCLTHGGYHKTYLRMAAEPFFVYMALIGNIIGFHASFSTNWTTGTYVALPGGWPYNVRVVNFFASLGLVGFLVKKYFDIHGEQANKLKAV